ncbi:MAG: CAP domain-containing protein [Candidatus Saccharimonadales bacterium]
MNKFHFRLKRKYVYTATALILSVLLVTVIFLVWQNRHLSTQNRSLSTAKEAFYENHVSSDQTTFVADQTSADIHILINAARRHVGEQELAYVLELEKSACAKADDMIANNYWSHVSPSGVDPWYFFSQQGIVYRNAGENLGYGFSNGEGLVDGWMNSKTHKENILSTVFTGEGICVRHADMYMNQKNQYVVVQHFYREL